MREAAIHVVSELLHDVNCPPTDLVALGGKIDKLCRYVPRQVPVRIPEKIAPNASFLIDSNHGHDQIACLALFGISGYQPLDVFQPPTTTTADVDRRWKLA